MSAFHHFLTALLGISVVTLKVSTGLSSKTGDWSHLVRRPGKLARAFLAINVIPAAVAIAIAYWLPLEPAVKAGIVLMGITPVQPIAPGKWLGMSSRKAYAHGIYVTMSILAPVAIPLGFAIAAILFGRDERVDIAVVAQKVVAGVLVPLLIGAGIQRLAPALAARVLPWVTQLGLALLTIGFFSMVIVQWPAMTHLFGNGALFAIAAVLLVALVGGHLLGGPDREERAILGLASASRHPGIALLLVAGTSLSTPSVEAAVLLFTLMGVITGVLYKLWLQRGRVAASASAPTHSANSGDSADSAGMLEASPKSVE